MDPLTRLAPDPDIPPDRLRLLLTVATAVNQSLEPHKVAGVSLKLALEAVAMKAGMVLLHPANRPVVLATEGFTAEWRDRFKETSPSIPNAVIQDIFCAPQPTIWHNLQQIQNNPIARLFQEATLQTLICLPLQVPGNVMGALFIGDPDKHRFEPGDATFLQAIAAHINTGLRNAWLFAQSQRQLEEVKSVTEAARAVVSSHNSNQVLTLIMEEVTTLLDVEAAAVLLLDHPRQELEFAAVAGPNSGSLKGLRLPMGQGIAGWVAQSGEAVLVPDVYQDDRFFKGLDRKTETVTKSIVCVPLRLLDQITGVVEAINKKRGQFSHTDQRMLEALSTFAAIAIQNARFYEEADLQIRQATLYARDFSATYKRERQQRESLDRLRYSFLNVVSHELKTPLTVILQGLETLRNPRRGLLNPEQTEIITMVDQQSVYLRRLIEGLITFATFSARQGTMKFSPAPFSQVLDEALALGYFKAVRKAIVLIDQRVPNLPTLSLDKNRLSEAIGHLIDNAVKFSPDNSKVIVKTTLETQKLLVQITDHGYGIPAENLEIIWDSFTQMNTTMERGLEGLGLGLAIARYIVEAHNGTITVDSKPGCGSTFTISLPLSA